MRLRSIWCCGLVFVGGCGAALYGDGLASQQAWKNDLAACEKAHPDRLKKPITPRVVCYGRANDARAAREGNADLVRAATTQVLVAAEKYDAGRINEIAYDAERAGIVANLNTQIALRTNSAAAVGAAYAQATATWNAALVGR